jgi:MFS family permease
MDENTSAKNMALTVAVIAAFITPFMASGVSVALPAIGAEYDMPAGHLNWVMTSFILAAAVFMVPFGRLADIHGRKRVFAAGMALFGITAGALTFAPSAGVFLALRALQGVAGAMIFGTSMAIVTSVFPASERGKALGINVAAVYLGLAAGPVVGGLLTEHFGWRSIFWLTAPLLLMGAAFTVLRLKGEWAEARGQKFDFAGSAVYAVALVSLMLGFTMLPGRPGLALCAAGALAFIALLVIETRIHAPVLDIRLFRGNPVFAMSNVAALINYAATFGITFLVSLYLQYCRGLTPEQAGLLMMAEPVPMALFSPLAGRLSDRMEPRVVASAGMALCVAGLLLPHPDHALLAHDRRPFARRARIRPLLVPQQQRRDEFRRPPALRHRGRHTRHDARHRPDREHGHHRADFFAEGYPRGANRPGLDARLRRQRADVFRHIHRTLHARSSRVAHKGQAEDGCVAGRERREGCPKLTCAITPRADRDCPKVPAPLRRPSSCRSRKRR